MAKFQAIICHRSFAEIKMLGLWYVAGAIPGKSEKENHGKWRQAGENEDVWITMRATTSWHAKYGKDDDDDDLCEDWRDEVENWAYIYEYTRE
jgi:hypothetical protein